MGTTCSVSSGDASPPSSHSSATTKAHQQVKEGRAELPVPAGVSSLSVGAVSNNGRRADVRQPFEMIVFVPNRRTENNSNTSSRGGGSILQTFLPSDGVNKCDGKHSSNTLTSIGSDCFKGSMSDRKALLSITEEITDVNRTHSQTQMSSSKDSSAVLVSHTLGAGGGSATIEAVSFPISPTTSRPMKQSTQAIIVADAKPSPQGASVSEVSATSFVDVVRVDNNNSARHRMAFESDSSPGGNQDGTTSAISLQLPVPSTVDSQWLSRDGRLNTDGTSFPVSFPPASGADNDGPETSFSHTRGFQSSGAASNLGKSSFCGSVVSSGSALSTYSASNSSVAALCLSSLSRQTTKNLQRIQHRPAGSSRRSSTSTSALIDRPGSCGGAYAQLTPVRGAIRNRNAAEHPNTVVIDDDTEVEGHLSMAHHHDEVAEEAQAIIEFGEPALGTNEAL